MKFVSKLLSLGVVIAIPIIGFSLYLSSRHSSNVPTPTQALVQATSANNINILDLLKSVDSIPFTGKVVFGGGLSITPSGQPNSPSIGQVYYDVSSNQLRVYDGTNFRDVITVDSTKTICYVGDKCGVLQSSIYNNQIINNVGSVTVGDSSIGAIQLKSSGVTPGTYGDGSAYPVFTVDADGRITSASTLTLPSGGSSSSFNNGGNSFGSVATVGTNDSNSLVIRTNNQSAINVAVGGAVTLQNATDSTAAFNVNNATGTPLLKVDTTNGETVFQAVADSTFTLGPELVADTDFSGANWSVSDAPNWVLTSSSATFSVGSYDDLVSNQFTAVIGDYYRFSVTVTGTTNDCVQVNIGGTWDNNYYCGNGTYSGVLIATTTDGVKIGAFPETGPNVTSITLSAASVKHAAYSTNNNPVLVVKNSDGTTNLEVRTSSDNSIAIGSSAGQTVLKNSIAFGYQALQSNTTGSDNLAIGSGSLKSNTSGYGGIAIGNNSLGSNIVGINNLAIGNSSLQSNSAGNFNLAIGNNSLKLNTLGNNNLAIGVSSMSVNTTGNNNISFGNYSLSYNTAGNNNIALGNSSLHNNTIGFDNIAIGASTLYNNTTGYHNVTIGGLGQNTTGYQNVAIGQGSLNGSSTGFRNAALGTGSLSGISTGSNNTAVGGAAGFNITTGSHNLVLGFLTHAPSPTANNQLNIGNILYGTSVDGAGYTLSTGAVGIGTTTPGARFEVKAQAGGSQKALIINNGTSTGSIAELQDNGVNVVSVADGGAALFQNTTNSTAAFNVNNATGTTLLKVDTTNGATILQSIADSSGSYTVGPELLTDQDFSGSSWSVTDTPNWVLTSSSATYGGQSNYASITTNQYVPISGTRYEYSFTLSAATADTCVYGFLGGNYISGGCGDGIYSGNVVARNTSNLIMYLYSNIGSPSVLGTVSSVSLKQHIFTTNVNPVLVVKNANGTTNLEIRTSGDGSIAIGNNAGSIGLYGGLAIGINALRYNTTGSEDTAIGNNSLQHNTIGYYNTAVGGSSLFSNTVGSNNTAVGFAGLLNNTIGSYNTAIGSSSLQSNTTGYENTASGFYSLNSNTTGYQNTASGSYNLYANTTGFFNTASGAQSLQSNTTGYNNTASGVNSLYSNTTGAGNTASGAQSLQSNTTGSYNTASGIFSLNYNTTGSYNTASGVGSLWFNTTGYYNTAVGGSSLQSNTTGSSNIGLGYGSGYNITTGSNNIAIGYNVYVPNGTGDNQLNIGNVLSGDTLVGSALFKNNVDSTTAFQIQNTGGTALFSVDTTAGNVVVGVVDTIGTLLVLDTKSSAGDPTGTDGGMYYNSSSRSFRCYSNTAWRDCIGGLVAANTSVPGGNTISNTVADTDFSSNYVIPANDCQPGKVYRVTASGVYGTTGTPNLAIQLRFGSTVIVSTGSNATGAGLINQPWRIQAQVTCDTTGASGTVEGQGMATLSTAATTAQTIGMGNTGTVTVDTTASNTVQLNAQWSTANASNTVTLRQFVVEALGL